MPKLLLPIEHYLQEEEAGCLAACAQMVLANLGITIFQAELNRLFELTPLGVPLSRLARLDQHGIKAIIITIPRKAPKKPLVAQFGAKPIRYVKHTIIKDEKPKPIYTRQNEIVQRLLADECELSGAKGRTEGHHIRKLADIRKKYKGRKHPPRWTAFMIERNRKAIMVCNNCHQAIHSGKYDGPKLT